MPNVLYVYTLAFPYGKGEAFLEAEIEVLSEQFKEIIIIPLSTKGKKRTMPGNVITKNILEESQVFKSGFGLKFQLISAAKIRTAFLKDFRYQLSLISDLASKVIVLKNFLKSQKIGIHYTYWLDEWATILSLLKKGGEIESFVSRVHGFDLYEERAKIGYKPFRNFQLKNVARVYAVSNSGQNYLMHKYPKFQGKIKVSFLGTKDAGIGKNETKKVMHLLSCSSVIPLKRVGHIIDVLKALKIRVQWTHIGGGTLLEDVKQKAEELPENIQCNLLGPKAHDDVLEFYLRNQVDCFINVSTTEGLPVSIMEALSFGVPILATDVGGVSEIVNEKTGKLIQVNKENSAFDLDEAREKLQLIFKEVSVSENWRRNIRKFWEQNFSAENNYTVFSEDIKSVSSDL